MKNWHRKGVKSLADVEALVAQFEAQRAMKQYGNKRQENIPEWFGMHQHEQQQQQQSQVNHEPIDFEAERQKILEKLQA